MSKKDRVINDIDEWILDESYTVVEDDFIDYYLIYLIRLVKQVRNWGDELKLLQKEELMLLDKIYQIYRDAGGLD